MKSKLSRITENEYFLLHNWVKKNYSKLVKKWGKTSNKEVYK